MNNPLTDQERTLWEKYFNSLEPISVEFTAKTWPIDTSTETDRAQYIGACCYAFNTLRDRQAEEL